MLSGTRDMIAKADKVDLDEELTTLLAALRAEMEDAQKHLSAARQNPVPHMIVRVSGNRLGALVEEFNTKIMAHVTLVKKMEELNRLEALDRRQPSYGYRPNAPSVMYLGDQRVDLSNAFSGSIGQFDTYVVIFFNLF